MPCAVFVQADVGHDRRNEAAAPQAASFLHRVGADCHHLVTVNNAALFVYGQTAVGVAVKRNAEVVAACFDRIAECFQMRRAAAIVDIDTVRLVVQILCLQREAAE